MKKPTPRKALPGEKQVCRACANHFPADAPTCLVCKWQADQEPEHDAQVVCTLRRIARALDTMRYYMWEDRGRRS